jgi:uncharacterized protein YbjT (DUF2867 family)
MFLVMGITGKVGGATAKHLLAHGKEVRALEGVEGAFVMLPAGRAPSPDYQEAKGRAADRAAAAVDQATPRPPADGPAPLMPRRAQRAPHRKP